MHSLFYILTQFEYIFPKSLIRMVPTIFYPNRTIFFDRDRTLTMIMMDFASLFLFGISSPPVAVALVLKIAGETVFSYMIISRCLLYHCVPNRHSLMRRSKLRSNEIELSVIDQNGNAASSAVTLEQVSALAPTPSLASSWVPTPNAIPHTAANTISYTPAELLSSIEAVRTRSSAARSDSEMTVFSSGSASDLPLQVVSPDQRKIESVEMYTKMSSASKEVIMNLETSLSNAQECIFASLKVIIIFNPIIFGILLLEMAADVVPIQQNLWLLWMPITMLCVPIAVILTIYFSKSYFVGTLSMTKKADQQAECGTTDMFEMQSNPLSPPVVANSK